MKIGSSVWCVPVIVCQTVKQRDGFMRVFLCLVPSNHVFSVWSSHVFLLVMVLPQGISPTANLIRFHLRCSAERWDQVWTPSSSPPAFPKQLLQTLWEEKGNLARNWSSSNQETGRWQKGWRLEEMNGCSLQRETEMTQHYLDQGQRLNLNGQSPRRGIEQGTVTGLSKEA